MPSWLGQPSYMNPLGRLGNRGGGGGAWPGLQSMNQNGFYPNPGRTPSLPGYAPDSPDFDWEDILADEPQLAYFGQQQRFGRSPVQKRFFKDQFQQVFNRYLGQLGEQVQGGQAPSLRFGDYMKDFDFNRYFGDIEPSRRGFFPSRTAPRTRFLYY
jgi:hypothetical protein